MREIWVCYDERWCEWFGGLRPSRLRSDSLFACWSAYFTRELSRDMGPVKSCLCHPMLEDLFLPSRPGELVLMGGLTRYGRQCSRGGENLVGGGLQSIFGWDKWRPGVYVGTCELVSIYPLRFSYSRELKIDSNRWCSPVVRMPYRTST